MNNVKFLINFVFNCLINGYKKFENILTNRYHATYGLAITRILIGLTGLGLILTNFNSRHYSFGVGSAWNSEIVDPKSDFVKIPLFSMFHNSLTNPALFTALIIGLAILAVVIMIGWKTRFILPVYFIYWVGFIELNDNAGDQGDNAYRIFMIALMFADTTRRLSLDAYFKKKKMMSQPLTNLKKYNNEWIAIMSNNIAIVVLAFQVCCIYMSGGLYKAGGEAWKQGFAIYNPLQTQQFGTFPILSDLLTTWGPAVAIISWGSILFQCAFPFLLLRRESRVIGLLGILSFHIGIAVLMGLPWFSLTMIAVDAIFISDRSFKKAGLILKKLLKRESLADLNK